MSGFGSTPTTTSQGSLSTNQVPISQVAVPGHAGGNLTAMEGGPASTDANGNETAPVSSYIKDGGDVAQGLTTDTAITSDANGTVSGKLRGLVKILSSVWDSVHGRLIVDGSQVTQPVSGTITANAGTNLNTSALALESGGHLASIDSHVPALGQALAAASVPVVLPAAQITTLTPPAAITGFALEAGHLATIDTNIAAVLVDTADIETNTANIPPLGQALAAASVPVVLTAAQQTALTPPAAITNFALESGGNLASILAALDDGQETMANSISVAIASDQSAVPASQSGTWTVQPGNTPNSTAWLVQNVVGTTGGSTPSHVISGASNNATSLKASAGMLYGGSVSNTNAAARYLKFYNKASAPAPATDNALIVWTIQVPANSTVPFAVPEGMVFSTGIAFAAVANMADTDNTSIGAGDLSIDIRYK